MTQMKRKVGDDAVFKATGKRWKQWFAALDKAGAKSKDHKGIVAWLGKNTDMSGWWRQMVAGAYEQERGLRAVHEMPDGFQIGKSKTVGASLATLYGAWSDARRRRSWLGESITVRKATKNKSMRVTWPDESHLDIYFYDKGTGKSSVTVNHGKLGDAKQADRMKVYWADRLTALKEYVER
jgi:hypothetical protein